MELGMAWRTLHTSPLVRALVALTVGVLMVTVLSVGRYRLEASNADIDFSQRATAYIAAIIDRMHTSIDSLVSVNQLFQISSEDISRAQFRQITSAYLSKFPYIKALVFHRLVTLQQRQQFEADRRRIFPGFVITELNDRHQMVPASIRPRYLVDDYIEPLSGNEDSLGYDSLSDPLQAEAVRRAVDTGQPAATRLKSFPKQDMGITIVMPVFRKGALTRDVASRRAAVIGDTEAVFVSVPLVTKILDDSGLLLAPSIHLNVYAAAGIDESKLIFRFGSKPPDSNRSTLYSRLASAFTDRKVMARTFDLAGTPWYIVVSSAPASLAGIHFGSLLIFVGGLFASLAMAFRTHAAATQSQRIDDLVRRRTAQLQSTTAALELRHRAIEASPNAIAIASALPPEYPIEYVNPAVERLTGYTREEIVGKSMRLMQGEAPDDQAIAELSAAINARQEAHLVFRYFRRDGTMYWADAYIAPVRDESGDIHHYVFIQYDISATKRYEEELEFRANYDTLTGLGNRNLLRDRLAQAILYSSRYQHEIWVAFIDLDRFKFVNDSVGHNAGDAVLKIVAARLRSAVSDLDTVARNGGDEFVLILPGGDPGKFDPEKTISRVLSDIAMPMQVDDKEFHLTCSIGIAIYPNDGSTANFLLSHADIAMFNAKKLGGNNVRFFEIGMSEGARKRLLLEADLRKAIDNKEFVLYYQPQIDSYTNQIVGVEALIRWVHPTLGLISPIQFIDLAEETGLIVKIGNWALREACAQTKAWQRIGIGKFRVAVNLSPLQFEQPDVVRSIISIAAQAGLAPDCLEIEMTEGVVMRNVEAAILKLNELKTRGVQISLDDFGTGYSSLSYLTRFPIDVMKIDQSFVRNIGKDEHSASLITSIISIAHNLRLRVIAEGVETADQLNFLCGAGADEIQGYYVSAPLAPEALVKLLGRGKVILPKEERV
jgi:diguanylate cyclase (GGDEF)-like protein/PAS domain S-box-containing protein